jgi:hypothetical protein
VQEKLWKALEFSACFLLWGIGSPADIWIKLTGGHVGQQPHWKASPARSLMTSVDKHWILFPSAVTPAFLTAWICSWHDGPWEHVFAHWGPGCEPLEVLEKAVWPQRSKKKKIQQRKGEALGHVGRLGLPSTDLGTEPPGFEISDVRNIWEYVDQGDETGSGCSHGKEQWPQSHQELCSRQGRQGNVLHS